MSSFALASQCAAIACAFCAAGSSASRFSPVTRASKSSSVSLKVFPEHGGNLGFHLPFFVERLDERAANDVRDGLAKRLCVAGDHLAQRTEKRIHRRLRGRIHGHALSGPLGTREQRTLLFLDQPVLNTGAALPDADVGVAAVRLPAGPEQLSTRDHIDQHGRGGNPADHRNHADAGRGGRTAGRGASASCRSAAAQRAQTGRRRRRQG
jgi:hypothetical protein